MFKVLDEFISMCLTVFAIMFTFLPLSVNLIHHVQNWGDLGRLVLTFYSSSFEVNTFVNWVLIFSSKTYLFINFNIMLIKISFQKMCKETQKKIKDCNMRSFINLAKLL